MDNKTIEKVMKLSRLDLREEEKREIPSQMKKILDYMENLNSISASDIKPLDSVYIKEMPFRSDTARRFSDIDEITLNAPFFSQGFFKVKKVIE